MPNKRYSRLFICIRDILTNPCLSPNINNKVKELERSPEIKQALNQAYLSLPSLMKLEI